MPIEGITIRRALAGDSAAREIVLAYALDFLREFLGTHIDSLADAEDIAQEKLIELDANLDAYKAEKPFENYLSGLAWNGINRYRAGEYVCGKRKRNSLPNEPRPADREIPASSWIEREDSEDDGEEDDGTVVGGRPPYTNSGIRYSPEAQREMDEAERAFRGKG